MFVLPLKGGIEMFEVKGRFNTAKIFTDVVDDVSVGQVIELCNQEFCRDSQIRLMPDIHAGAGCTVGTTMTIKDKVVPNLVGVDIGCGMETVQLQEKDLDLAQLDKLIYAKIPSGFAIRQRAHKYNKRIDLSKLKCAAHTDLNRAQLSLGTLGGGNHFIEANRDDDGSIYLVVHSGSRHLGLEVANYYQNAGYKALRSFNANKLIAELKAAGRQQEIENQLKVQGLANKIPKALAYVEGDLFTDYLHDMRLVQQFAALNRQAMLDEIIEGLGLHVAEQFTTTHNYIDTDAMILRKGSVSAQAGEILLIPINMRDGSLICRGLGNADWNYSAPHGAGRLMSRSAAKQAFDVAEFQAQMSGIYTTSVGQSTLDECPMAYKSMDSIVENIAPTAEIIKVIKPIYNFKAGGE